METVIARGRLDEDDLSLLLRLAAAADENRDTKTLAEQLLPLLGTAIHAERGALLSLEAESNQLELIAFWGSGSNRELIPGESLIRHIEKERKAVLWSGGRPHRRRPGCEGERPKAGCLLAAPLTAHRGFRGVLTFQSTFPVVFTEHQLKLAAIAAALSGLAFGSEKHGERRRSRCWRRGVDDHGLIGESEPMARLRDFIDRVAPVDTTVLLRGESGTGKELVARALHRASPRSNGPLVAINCATLSETLLESELFGHEKGAFTGAVGRKIGKLEAASGGTLFLDEVGELPLALQARLLRVLQERCFERVGGTRSIEVDLRVVAATNRNLEAALEDGTFRDDLFYRLDVISTDLPPLRERREDMALLARHFARLHGKRLGRHRVELRSAALRLLRAYEWPGNVRQLSNVVERAIVLGNGEAIRPADLPEPISGLAVEEISADATSGAGAFDLDLGDYQATITEIKKRLLTTALEEADGNAAEAGRRLGLHPNSFRRLVRQLGLRTSSVS